MCRADDSTAWDGQTGAGPRLIRFTFAFIAMRAVSNRGYVIHLIIEP
jgi:hypothetical protein